MSRFILLVLSLALLAAFTPFVRGSLWDSRCPVLDIEFHLNANPHSAGEFVLSAVNKDHELASPAALDLHYQRNQDRARSIRLWPEPHPTDTADLLSQSPQSQAPSVFHRSLTLAGGDVLHFFAHYRVQDVECHTQTMTAHIPHPTITSRDSETEHHIMTGSPQHQQSDAERIRQAELEHLEWERRYRLQQVQIRDIQRRQAAERQIEWSRTHHEPEPTPMTASSALDADLHRLREEELRSTAATHNEYLRRAEERRTRESPAAAASQLRTAGNDASCPALYFRSSITPMPAVNDTFTLNIEEISAQGQTVGFVDATLALSSGSMRHVRLARSFDAMHTTRLDLPGVSVPQGQTLHAIISYEVNGQRCQEPAITIKN